MWYPLPSDKAQFFRIRISPIEGVFLDGEYALVKAHEGGEGWASRDFMTLVPKSWVKEYIPSNEFDI